MAAKSQLESNDKMILRTIVERLYLASFWGQTFQKCVGIGMLVTSFIMVTITYFYEIPPQWFKVLNFIVLIVLLADYLIRVYIATHRISFLTSRNSFMDIIVLLPLVIPNDYRSPSSIFFMASSYLIRSVVAGRIMIKFIMLEKQITRQIFTILLTLFLLVYIAAGMFMSIENTEREYRNWLRYHQAVYFIIVTLSTVGYGEINPDTELGRVFVVLVMIVTIVIIPRQTNELLRLLGMQSVYARSPYKANSEVPHIICTGQVTLDALKNTCDELFHEDHGIQNKNLVILQPGDPNSALELFLNGTKYKYELFLTFLNGDTLSKSGLKHCDAHKAKECIILTNKNSRDPQSSDHKNILTALAMKKYVYENKKVSLLTKLDYYLYRQSGYVCS